MKGIILAGGSGVRLRLMTMTISQQLLRIYDMPIFYCPLSILILAESREILVISMSQDLPRFRIFLGNGEKWGLSLNYAEQPLPDGLAPAFIIGAEFINGNPSASILSDNVFYGHGRPELLEVAVTLSGSASVFAYHVADPERYGVVILDGPGRALAIEDKPKVPQSNWAVTGRYFYDGRASDVTRSLKLSARGEHDIAQHN